VRDLTAPIREPPGRADLSCTRLTEREIPTLLAMDRLLTRDEIQRRVQAGEACYLYWLGENLAHYRWEATQPVFLPYLGLTVRPLAGDVFCSGAFTAPRHRRCGVQSAACLMAIARQRETGLRRSITDVAWWNAPSLRVERDKASRSAVGSLGYWRLGRLRHYQASGRVRLEPRGEFWVEC